jgi:hypothetical protein
LACRVTLSHVILSVQEIVQLRTLPKKPGSSKFFEPFHFKSGTFISNFEFNVIDFQDGLLKVSSIGCPTFKILKSLSKSELHFQFSGTIDVVTTLFNLL